MLVSLRMRNYGNYFKIYLFVSFMTSRDIVGRFFTMFNANIGLCSQVSPYFSITEVNFALGMRRGNLSKWFYIKKSSAHKP